MKGAPSFLASLSTDIACEKEWEFGKDGGGPWLACQMELHPDKIPTLVFTIVYSL